MVRKKSVAVVCQSMGTNLFEERLSDYIISCNITFAATSMLLCSELSDRVCACQSGLTLLV